MKVGVAQVTLYNDMDTNLATISKYLSLASKEDIDILCFPECNITGYVRDFSKVNQNEVKVTLNDILTNYSIVYTSFYDNFCFNHQKPSLSIFVLRISTLQHIYGHYA